jgi:tellurite resistance protein
MMDKPRRAGQPRASKEVVLPDEKKPLSDRRRALEEEFFSKENARLREKLREAQQRETLKAELREALKIEEEKLLDALVELGLKADTAVALGLVPMVEVAWADGKLEAKERDALLRVASEYGVDPRHPSYGLLESWLTHRPRPQMLELWSDYIAAIVARLDEAERAAMRERMLGRARHVAEAAGGILGLGKKVSPEEESVLQSLARAFERP